ncbi:Inner membrane protein YiaV precursor [Roseimaritima multifibrata]|uniref:Inner membrane protein YiaV n=1 Tax=Roseimaritima multifibrata TaxID=1930274 RepID=A0A517MAI4_9BACT|nr:HlyD family efflux transporter periplasmic adaptor subunit [Roseimaritima multifibrata]QDS91903.1 Inner membrane protein YiaV precursor [Roseimaritima multifibrata]
MENKHRKQVRSGMVHGLWIPILGGLLAQSIGCSKPVREFPPKAPQPVTVMSLEKRLPPVSYFASGSVKSWKNEKIGFEVSGRVQWVLEPGQDIDGRVYDADKNLIQKGTPLAQIDPAHYVIAVKSAKANLEMAEAKRDSLKIRLEESLVADVQSAEAELELAGIEFERVKGLKEQNAISQAQFDQARILQKTRQAALRSLDASKRQTETELKSAAAEIEAAKQALLDAERDVENTTLYGSYQGQISEVMVVPGSVVNAGDPILTLQMTNPIKVEVELSSQQSRQLRRRRGLPASFRLPDGSMRHENAFVYSMDSSADPTTRTFTMTLLMLNEKSSTLGSTAEAPMGAVYSEDIWPLKLNRMMGTPENVVLVEEQSIVHEGDQTFVYLVTNTTRRDLFPEVLKVRKQMLEELDLRVPFLGNWFFRSVQFKDDDGKTMPVDEDWIYVGTLEGGEETLAHWDGESVVLNSHAQWMHRPGDLVAVNLASDQAEEGFYVPIEAIYEEAEQCYVFAIQDGKVKRLRVDRQGTKNLDAGALFEIRSPELVSGMEIVVGGIHFLRDDQPVRVIAKFDASSLEPTQVATEAL